MAPEDGGHGVDCRLRQGRAHATDQVEGEVLEVPHGVFDVVAEDPEIQHVPADVREARVHEHRDEEGLDADGRIAEEPRGNELQVVPHHPVQLAEKDQYVRRDEGVVDERDGARREVVAERKHRRRGYFVFLSATLTNLSVMRSLSPMAMYFSRSFAPSCRVGGSTQTPSA